MKAGPVIIPAAFAVALVALGLAGEQDYQEVQSQQAHYCEMVAEGWWPDYQGNFESICNRTRVSG